MEVEKITTLVISIVIVLLIIIFLYYQNNKISLTKLTIKSKKLPIEFNKTKIVHLSDLHNKRFGKNHKNIVNVIKNIKPDFIFFTGDLIDRRIYRGDIAIQLLEKLNKISKVYYVTGNHEWGLENYENLKQSIENTGTIVLNNKFIKINKGYDSLYILGVDDLEKYSYKNDKLKKYIKFSENLKNLVKKIPEENFKILLSHRPELFDLYSSEDIDIVFSGHVHGGQVRLPFIGGLFSPSQGFFPKYTSGVYTLGDSKLILSRGLGNSSIAPQRIFNRPEVVFLSIEKE